MDIDYGDSLMIADASEGSAVEFYPDYRISVTGSNMDYSVKIVMDNGLSEASDWHTLTVSGSRTDKVRLEKTDSGFVLTSPSLKDVTVSFESDKDQAEVSFSTDRGNVLFYETEEHTIAAAVDADNDNTYETVIAQSETSESELGDVTGDGVINAKDAAEVLIAAAKIGTGKESGLTAEKETAADVNGDGTINAKDANIILRYAAAVGTGKADKITDYI